jgi:gamma-glutamylcyclotransferase (GGCT)/AIG2-like uncharacterized protein YtfP
MLLFVYGTLRRGEAAAGLMLSAEFAGVGGLRGRVVQTPAGYTGLVEGGDWIEGEIYRVEENIFERLDAYEGPDYVGRITTVFAGDEELAAWVYWLRYDTCE